MDYRYIDELTEDEGLSKILANLQRGNHKSAQDESDQVAKLLKKDVDHGFTWIIPKQLVPLLPQSMVQPLGLAKQWRLNETGERIPKYRLTQDLSFTCVKGTRGMSVNSRIDMTAYPEMIYRWCIPRILHYIIALWLAFPDTPVLIAKYDYSDAYRRVAHSATAVAQTISTCNDYAYIYNRLTFGGSPNPPTWCNFSEIVTNLPNEISQCKDFAGSLTWAGSKKHARYLQLFLRDVLVRKYLNSQTWPNQDSLAAWPHLPRPSQACDPPLPPWTVHGRLYHCCICIPKESRENGQAHPAPYNRSHPLPSKTSCFARRTHPTSRTQPQRRYHHQQGAPVGCPPHPDRGIPSRRPLRYMMLNLRRQSGIWLRRLGNWNKVHSVWSCHISVPHEQLQQLHQAAWPLALQSLPGL
jgi:hypothetical protein